ncbi:MAG: hypothetical protein ABSE58_00965 [Candidatus Limnocylindrales bacterium]
MAAGEPDAVDDPEAENEDPGAEHPFSSATTALAAAKAINARLRTPKRAKVTLPMCVSTMADPARLDRPASERRTLHRPP